ncbi:MAG: YicC family protein [Gammaproteobacteria bacterium]|nr:YicC family protein [Gammaproteobacteria bacterium]
MINSMTGFGRVERPMLDGQLQWEIRSVNHRYLEIQMKLPDGLRSMEHDFRRLISEKVKRGKLDAVLSLTKNDNDQTVTKLNAARARQVIDQLETLARQIKNPAAVSPMAILRWPGVLEEESIDPQTVIPLAQDALEAAVTELCKSRAREGTKVQKMLAERCVDMEALINDVRTRLPSVLVEIRKKLDQRVEALQVKLDNDRLEQELAIIAQKLDVSEELDRLAAHIDEVRSTLGDDKPVGRRLDFLMQELNREANTLGSKSADSETTRQVVDLKVLIEQMREQVQNVE